MELFWAFRDALMRLYIFFLDLVSQGRKFQWAHKNAGLLQTSDLAKGTTRHQSVEVFG